MIGLKKADVHLTKKPDDWGHYGYFIVREGKTEFRKRALPITGRVREILKKWMPKSKCDLVFTREDGTTPVSPYTLVQQQERMRDLLGLPRDAVVHSGRHTGLTNLGLTGMDPFTLQRVAGHASITTTRKYVHPTPSVMKDAFKKKALNERRARRAARKRESNVVVMMPAVEPRSKAAVL